MGNNLKARLHLNKKTEKTERPPRGEQEAVASQSGNNPGRTEIDQAIMSGPNRARIVESSPPETSSKPRTTRGIQSSTVETTTANSLT